MFTRMIIPAILFLAVACTPNPIQKSAPPQDILEAITEEPSAATPVPSPVVEDGLEKKLTQIVLSDLATRLSMEPEGISVVSTKAMVWPNAALGCPRPGKVYAQGKVPGFRIRLAAEDKEYSYHTDRAGAFILCPAEDPDIQNLPEIPVTPGQIDDNKPWIPAD